MPRAQALASTHPAEPVGFESFLESGMDAVRKAGLYRFFRHIEGPIGPEVVMRDEKTGERHKVLLFCSNSYLGLCDHPALKEAAAKAALEWGVGSGASRHISGSLSLHRELEERLAAFKGCERAILYNTGYMANVGIVSTLMDSEDEVFSDELNHASLIDGCRLSGAKKSVYRHSDLGHLEELLKASRAKKKLIVTDSLFSMDGDLAPLPGIVEIARRYGAWTLVDEAHATGCLGREGRGAIEHFGLSGQIDVVMGTLGKALGSFGAFAAGSARLIEYLINRSRMLIFTTSLPPAALAATLAALDVLAREPDLPRRLEQNALRLREGLHQGGFSTLESRSHIVPVVIGEAGPTMEFARKLFEQGVFVTGIRPPTVPPGTCRLRVTVMATHTEGQIDRALEATRKIGKELGIV